MLPLHFVVRTLPACESKRALCAVFRFFLKASSTPACDFLSYRLQNVPYMWTTFELSHDSYFQKVSQERPMILGSIFSVKTKPQFKT